MDSLVNRLVTNVLALPPAGRILLRSELKRLNPAVSDTVERRLTEIRLATQTCLQRTDTRAKSLVTAIDRPVPPDSCYPSPVRADSFLSQSLLLSCGVWFLRRRSCVAVECNQANCRATSASRWQLASPVEMLAMLAWLFRRTFVFSSPVQKNG